MSWASDLARFERRIRFSVLDDSQATAEKMLARLEGQLRTEGARNIRRQGDVITFSGQFFRLRLTARFLGITDAGFIRVTADGGQLVVDYCLSFLWILTYCLLISFILLFLLMSIPANLQSYLIVFGTFWATVLIFNVFFPLLSISSFIQRALFDIYQKP